MLLIILSLIGSALSLWAYWCLVRDDLTLYGPSDSEHTFLILFGIIVALAGAVGFIIIIPFAIIWGIVYGGVRLFKHYRSK